MGKADLTIPACFRYVHVNKAHTCEACEKIIPKGSIALNVHGRIGIWFNEYFCWGCDIDRINSIPDEALRKRLFDEKARLQVSGDFVKKEAE